ncbi:aldehyde dehydrogenase [Pseudoroseomonas oryzae]|uniref:Aldehyde dehydrogenase n=2 Tax=Teichococcus oryzae TaxID=1608942 RepID=A0A5B2TDQ4_9PROT|nr:aldehyde dehydrogenase [Pseudoroseomonas oryzae]
MQEGTMDRRDAVRDLLADRAELLVVSGLGSPSYDVFAAGDNAANFYLWGAMGGAAIMGLGLALARPCQPVAVITGDGEAMMGVGGLLTISVRKPSNLTVVVLDNGQFGETGMQRSHAGLGVDLAALARGAGFSEVVTLHDPDEVAAFRPRLQEVGGGPRFAVLRIAPGNQERALPARDGVYLKNRFREKLGIAVD